MCSYLHIAHNGRHHVEKDEQSVVSIREGITAVQVEHGILIEAAANSDLLSKNTATRTWSALKSTRETAHAPFCRYM